MKSKLWGPVWCLFIVVSALPVVLVVVLCLELLSSWSNCENLIESAAPPTPIYGTDALRRWYTKDEKPLATVLLVHGFTQQSGSMDTLAKKLTDAGFDVAATDLRGHGRWFYDDSHADIRKILSYKKSATDLESIAEGLRKENRKRPVFCLGESVGGAVAARAAADRPDLFSGVVIASGGTMPQLFDIPMVAADFLRGVSNVDRPLSVASYIKDYASEDSRITTEMLGDPLARKSVTARELVQTFVFLQQAVDEAKKLPTNIPVLIIDGASDSIVNSESTYQIFSALDGKDKHRITMGESGHVLYGTKFIKERAVSALISWLQSHCGSSNSTTVSE